MFLQEVGHPNGPYSARGIDLLQGLPGPDEQSLGRYRPVNEVQVNHVNAQRRPAGFEGFRRAGVLPVAQFGGDEEFLARDPAGGNRGSYPGFIAVSGSRVDMPVARLQRVLHHALRLLPGDLEYTKAKLGNADPVVQPQVRNENHANSMCSPKGTISA